VREGWYLADIAAGVADGTVVPRFGFNSSHTQLLAGLAGRVIAIVWRVTAAPTAGAIRVQARTGGVTSPDVVVINNASGTSGVLTLATPQTFSAGTQINPVYGSDAGLTPTTIDLGAGLVVAYNYQP
jgi:hypothetical protein